MGESSIWRWHFHNIFFRFRSWLYCCISSSCDWVMVSSDGYHWHFSGCFLNKCKNLFGIFSEHHFTSSSLFVKKGMFKSYYVAARHLWTHILSFSFEVLWVSKKLEHVFKQWDGVVTVKTLFEETLTILSLNGRCCLEKEE